MSYGPTALIGPFEAIADAARLLRRERYVDLTPDLKMLLLDDASYCDGPFGTGFHKLSGAIVAAAAEASRVAPIAYLEAELFGGMGLTSSVVWDGGQVALGPIVYDDDDGPTERPPLSEGAFNQALRYLGVAKIDPRDEFDTVGLGRHRDSDWPTQRFDQDA